MFKKIFLIIFIVGFVGLFFGVFQMALGRYFIDDIRFSMASLFFVNDVTYEETQKKYKKKKLSVLIVPGHDNIDGGTWYKGKLEAYYNAKIGGYLYEYLDADNNIIVTITRDENGYKKEFADYFTRQKPSISLFINRVREYFKSVRSDGSVNIAPPPMTHMRASSRMVNILYGINKWVNENNIDIVLHLHLNDYPRRSWERKYDGYSIYIPDKAFSNYEVSKKIAENLSSVFESYWVPSNLHLEQDTIIEDSALIALGSYGSLRPASVLLEYGYIYESKFQTDIMLKEVAFRTYQGLLEYFNDGKKISNDFAWLLPYEWEDYLAFGALYDDDVAALQSALFKLGFYPANGRSLRSCPVNGNFKYCTRAALQNFQNSNGIFADGEFGWHTRQKLNKIF